MARLATGTPRTPVRSATDDPQEASGRVCVDDVRRVRCKPCPVRLDVAGEREASTRHASAAFTDSDAGYRSLGRDACSRDSWNVADVPPHPLGCPIVDTRCGLAAAKCRAGTPAHSARRAVRSLNRHHIWAGFLRVR